MGEYLNRHTLSQEIQQEQNIVDYRDADAVGMKFIKDDKIFTHNQNMSLQQLKQDGINYVAHHASKKHWWSPIKSILHKMRGELPSEQFVRDEVKAVPGEEKVSDLLQQGKAITSVNNIANHLDERQNKYKICRALLFRNPHLNEGLNQVQQNKLPRFDERIKNEIRANFEHKYSYQNISTYTYLDDPFLKVVDDSYHRNSHINNVDLGEAGYIVKDQTEHHYDPDIQRKWNQQHSIYIKNDYNISLRKYLGVAKENSELRIMTSSTHNNISNKRYYKSKAKSIHIKKDRHQKTVPEFPVNIQISKRQQGR